MCGTFIGWQGLGVWRGCTWTEVRRVRKSKHGSCWWKTLQEERTRNLEPAELKVWAPYRAKGWQLDEWVGGSGVGRGVWDEAGTSNSSWTVDLYCSPGTVPKTAWGHLGVAFFPGWLSPPWELAMCPGSPQADTFSPWVINNSALSSFTLKGVLVWLTILMAILAMIKEIIFRQTLQPTQLTYSPSTDMNTIESL